MSYIQQLAQDDFIWEAIVENLPASRRSRTSDYAICCPMCVRLGEPRPDTRFRCGLAKTGDGFQINCFNCPFKLRWTYGSAMSGRLKEFMTAIGVPELQVKRMSHRAFSIRKAVEQSPHAIEIIGTSYLPTFTPVALPSGARPLKDWADDGCDDPNFLRVVEYLYNDRGPTIAESIDYYWTPNANKIAGGGTDRMNERVLIPFYHKNVIVGYTGRLAGGSGTKYWSNIPSDYLFNNRVLDLREREYVFIVEGPFDALAIDGLSTLGAKLSDKQLAWIKHSGRKPVLVADRDRSGMRNIDNALKNDWGVAFPRLSSTGWWASQVKDCAEAVKAYGRLYVARSIIETITFDKRKIEVYRKLTV